MKSKLDKFIKKSICKHRIDEIARESKFIQRNSEKMNSQIFFELNVFDNKNICTESLGELSTFLYKSKKIKITPQALDERFNTKAVDFLKQIFQEIMTESIKNQYKINTEFTNHFNRIRITDSSNIELPNKCKNKYKGYGGSAKESAAKLQVTYDIKAGSIALVDVSDVTTSDAGYLPALENTIEKGDLELKDLGYFSLKNFETIEESSAYYLSRLKTNTTVYILNPNPEKHGTGNIVKSTEYIKLDLVKEANALKANEIKEIEAFIGRRKVKTRLVLCRLPEEAVARKLENHKKVAKKKQTKTSKKSKDLSIVNFYITNVSAEIIPKEIVFLTYSLRWQIEIIFKILKSTLEIDKIKDVKLERVQCHLYSTLIKMLLSSQIVFSLREEIYTKKSKEISEIKAFKIVNVFFEELKNAIFHSTSKLKIVLKRITEAILKNGIKSKHKKKKTVLAIFNINV